MSVFLQDILAGCKEGLSLSSQSGVILERLGSLPQQKSGFLGSSSGDSSPGLSEEISASVSSTGSIPDISAKHATLSAAPSLRIESEQASLVLVFQCFNFTVLAGSFVVFGCWRSERNIQYINIC